MNPFFSFILLILGLPTLELYLLMEVGGEIGAIPTVVLVVFTAVLGAALVRRQGVQTLLRVRQTLDRGELPALELAEGALLLLAGLLLLIPGFLTDAVGFLLLVPPLRAWLLAAALRRVQVRGAVPPPGPAGSGQVIEGEFRRHGD